MLFLIFSAPSDHAFIILYRFFHNTQLLIETRSEFVAEDLRSRDNPAKYQKTREKAEKHLV